MLITSYENENFEGVFELYNEEISQNINFKKCVFHQQVLISQLKVKGKIVFEDCTFNSTFIIENLECNFLIFYGTQIRNFTLKDSNIFYLTITDLIGKGIGLSNCNITYTTIERTALDNLIINNLNSNYLSEDSNISLEDSKIKKVEIKSISLNAKLSFTSGEYEMINILGLYINPVSFTGLIFVENLFIDSCTFKNRIDFKEGNFENINLSRNVFLGLVVISDWSKALWEEDKELRVKNISVNSNIFEQDFTISYINIESLDLASNNFKQTFHFYSPTKSGNSITVVLAGTNSGNIIFEDFFAHIDLNCINFGYIYFRNISLSMLIIKEFQNNSLLSFSNLRHDSLRTFLIIENSNIGRTEFIDTDFSKFSEIVFANSIIEKSTYSSYPFNIKSYSREKIMGFGTPKKDGNKNLSNIYKQLKQIALSNKDIDIASKYQSLEYKHLMRNKKIYHRDKILLFFNFISNSNGYNWARGILFTFVVSLICFIGYAFSVCMDWELKQLLENYVAFFTSFPKLQLDSYTNETILAQISIWASRVFIGYGIYQTIAAFRKYGKS